MSDAWSVEDCQAFLRVGVITLGEWISLSKEQRAVMVEAGRLLDLERAGLNGLAAQDRLQALSMLGDKEGLEDARFNMVISEFDAAQARRREGR